jgi:hypothetical protein
MPWSHLPIPDWLVITLVGHGERRHPRAMALQLANIRLRSSLFANGERHVPHDGVGQRRVTIVAILARGERRAPGPCS